MIIVTTPEGHKITLAAQAIASVRETGASSQWHGIRAIVKCFDGETIEVQEQAKDIVNQWEKDQS